MCTVTQMINELKGTRPPNKRKHITNMNIDSEVKHKDTKKCAIKIYIFTYFMGNFVLWTYKNTRRIVYVFINILLKNNWCTER